MSSLGVSFLPVLPQDEVALTDLRRIALETFLETFQEHYDPADLEQYIDERLSLARLSQEVDHPAAHFFLLKVGETVAGYCKYEVPCHRYFEHVDQEIVQPACLLERFYLLKAYQGQGWADLIMQFVLRQARFGHQAAFLYLNVWEENVRAQRFYQRYGFTQFGEFGYPVGKQIDTEWLYGLVLS